MNLIQSGVSTLLRAGAWTVSTILRYVPFRILAGGAFVLACKHPAEAAKAYDVANQAFQDVATSGACSGLIEGVTALSDQIEWKYKVIAVGSAFAYDNIASSSAVRYALGALAVWGYYNPDSIKNVAVTAGVCLASSPKCVAAALAGIGTLLVVKSVYRYVVDKLSQLSNPQQTPAVSK